MSAVADYSWSRPSPQALKDNGFIGVVRYLGPGNGGRDISQAEMDALHAAGLGVGFVWETTATAALAGYAPTGNAAALANQYLDALGVPDWVPFFIAVDTDVTPDQVRGPVADSFRGAIARSKRPVRPYGEADVLDILCGELGLMPCGWQCMAWSRGHMSDYRCMYQVYPPVMGGAVDSNELGPKPTDFLWHPTIPFDAPITGDELDVAAKDEIIDAIVNVQNNLAGVTRGVGEDIKTEIRAQVAAEIDALVNVQGNLANVVTAVLAKVDEIRAAGGEVDVAELTKEIAGSLAITPKS